MRFIIAVQIESARQHILRQGESAACRTVFIGLEGEHADIFSVGVVQCHFTSLVGHNFRGVFCSVVNNGFEINLLPGAVDASVGEDFCNCLFFLNCVARVVRVVCAISRIRFVIVF